MRQIRAINGGYAKVDRCDYEYLRTFRWRRDWKGYFCVASGPLKGRRMNRLIAKRAGIDTSHQIDHKNRTKSDNRRKNLRPATNGNNRANSKRNANNKSGFKGVHLKRRRPLPRTRKPRSDRMGDRWVAQITAHGKKLFLGYYSTPQKAHDAYRKAAIKHFGEFANP
jgi:hypothetical protein